MSAEALSKKQIEDMLAFCLRMRRETRETYLTYSLTACGEFALDLMTRLSASQEKELQLRRALEAVRDDLLISMENPMPGNGSDIGKNGPPLDAPITEETFEMLQQALKLEPSLALQELKERCWTDAVGCFKSQVVRLKKFKSPQGVMVIMDDIFLIQAASIVAELRKQPTASQPKGEKDAPAM